MNYLWAGMMLVAIVYGAVHGTIPEVTQAALDSSKEAVTLCITMLGILSFWMGLMQVASASGLIERMRVGSGRSSVAVPQDTKRTSGDGTDCGELYCEHPGFGLGGDTGGAESDGGA